ncbi:MAG: mevalonate kinase [Calditrichaceae bacterium]
MILETTAPGKMILLGEYAVLEGAPSLVCAVDRYAVIRTQKREDNRFCVDSSSIHVSPVDFDVTASGLICFDSNTDSISRKKLNFFKVTFEFAWQYFKSLGIRIPPSHFSMNTNLFYSPDLSKKYGFGSSAAMTVALFSGLFRLAGLSVEKGDDRARLFRLALGAHRKAQGNLGSGIDIAASTYGGILVFKMILDNEAKQVEPSPVETCRGLHMTTVWTGSSESTRKMIRGVSQLKKEKPSVYQDLINKLTALAENGCFAYKAHDVEKFMTTVSEYYEVLAFLGKKSDTPIISPVHQKLAELVKITGGVYKPSGAGSGDIGIAFSDSPEKKSIIAEKLKTEGYQAIDIKPALSGASSEILN